jgi:SAM-dependent methyltransferase
MNQPIAREMPGPVLTEQAEYDRRWANEGYSAENIGYTPSFLKFMADGVSGLKLGRPPRALEVGCGNGFFSGQLAKLGCEVTGIDLSPAGLRLAQSRYPDVTFTAHDLTQPLPFVQATFDLVWCSEVLEHLFSPLGTVTEISRVLRPGGTFLCTVPFHGLIKNLGIALFAFEKHYDPTYPHLRFFTRKSLSGIVNRSGLQVENVDTCGSGLGLRDLVAPTNILLRARKNSEPGPTSEE